MRRALLTFSRQFYSQQKKNVFVLPRQAQIPVQCLTEVQTVINRSKSCGILAAALKNNIQWFTDEHIRMMYRHMRLIKLTADDNFHSVIAPISLEYIKCFNREHSLALFQMIMYILQNNVDNLAVKEAILKKLDQENVYRYIPLYETSQLLNELLDQQDMRNHSLTKKLIGVVYQQKKFYEYGQECRNQISHIRNKLEKYQGSDPQLTEAYKQLA